MSDVKGRVRVTQLASALGRKPGQKETLVGLGLKTIRSTLVWNPISNFEADLVTTYLKDRSPSVGVLPVNS